jgi:galactose oxidase
MNWITTLNSGSLEVSILRGDDSDAMNGNAVMYDVGKILTLGGAPNYGTGVASARAYVIDLNGPAVSVQRTGSMNFARSICNSVVLPNGEVVVVGGQSSVVLFSDNNAVLEAEIWNPWTGRFTALSKMRIPRTYHSVALLMKDGRVWVAGQCIDKLTRLPGVSPVLLILTSKQQVEVYVVIVLSIIWILRY